MPAASWGFTAKGETSCIPVPYSCPHWELFFQAGVWLGSRERLALNRVKIWAGWRSDRESGLSESAAGTGISSGMHWFVLLESRRLTHLVPAKNLAPLLDGTDLCSGGQ